MSGLLGNYMPPFGLYNPPKRKIFISYHHKGDQNYCDWLRDNLSDELEVFTDRSLNEPVRSDDAEYVNRKIREDFINGSSITIVLCGAETYKRKYVDWEIYSTLYYEHALLGIGLPTALRGDQGGIIVSNRLHANIQSGYAHWVTWDANNWLYNKAAFVSLLETAIVKSKNKTLIKNSELKMSRNAS